MEYLTHIRCELLMDKIKCNSHFKNVHIVKVLCGFGHGREGNYEGLKEKFLIYFKENLYDFAYVEKDGVFLLRINV